MEWFEKKGVLLMLVYLHKAESANQTQVARAIRVTQDTLRESVIPELEKRQLIMLQHTKKFPWAIEIRLTKKGEKIASLLHETGIFLGV